METNRRPEKNYLRTHPSNKQVHNARNYAKLPQSPVQRLLLRELGGVHRTHYQPVRNHVFHKWPGRLGFSLASLVDESVLHAGHVFLGFTKSGSCLMSYTLNLETDEHTAYPFYVYKLHWWHFVPYKRLRKVGEVRLFGEEETQPDLFLVVCEWPADDSRIVIHGYCQRGENEEKHQCYVTVTAVPPTKPCEDCSQLNILHARTGSQCSLTDVPPRCLNHAFTVHTKYELAPPYPSFMPKVFLKLDGVVVLNTGDSLIALSVDIEDNHSGFGIQLYSPRVTRSVSNLSELSGSLSEEVVSVDSHSTGRSDADFTLTEPLLNLVNIHSPCTSSGVHRVAMPKDATNVEHRGAALRERRPSMGKENQAEPLASPPLVDSPRLTTPPTTRNHRSLDIYNFEGNTPNKDEDDYNEPDLGSSLKHTPVRASLSFNAVQQGARMQNSPDTLAFDTLLDSPPLDCEEKTDVSSDSGHFEKPCTIPRTAVLSSTSHHRPLSGISVAPTSADFSKSVCISPGYSKLDTGSSSCSSCVSSPIILQSESQCFTYSLRRFVDTYTQTRPESPLDMEDDLNLAYHSLLPLDVHGANYNSMKLLTKQCFNPHSPCVVVKQLTLDIEHYLGEAIKTCADWGHRYLSFTDYDIQIVEVCADTSEVIAVVFVLIRARPPKDLTKPKPGTRSVPKLYQTGFKLIWNLQTGSYRTLHVEDLVEVNQAQLLRLSGKNRWHPGSRVCETLQRECAVPQVYGSTVYVLTNEAVFKGKSLKVLFDRQHCAAIVL